MSLLAHTRSRPTCLDIRLGKSVFGCLGATYRTTQTLGLRINRMLVDEQHQRVAINQSGTEASSHLDPQGAIRL